MECNSTYSNHLISELRDQVLGYRFEKGKAIFWGYLDQGSKNKTLEQTTNEVNKDVYTIKEVEFDKSIKELRNVIVVKASCGNNFALFLSSSYEVFSMGSNAHGCLGVGSPDTVVTKLVKIPCTDSDTPFVEIMDISAGACHCMALSTGYRLYTWGNGNSGRLGHNSSISEAKPKMVRAFEDIKIIFISAGYSCSAAISSQNELYTWGNGSHGKLGHGFTDDEISPRLVSDFKETKIIYISCGFDHSLCICMKLT
jgi:E3 ubiquitin-protein ligase HERC4